MKKATVLALASIFISLAGVIVIMGWIFDIGILKSILPQWISMKFSTAICFFLSGVTLFFIVKGPKLDSGIRLITLSTTSMFILLIMATLLVSNFMGVCVGIEDLFIKEEIGTVKTFFPGRPSIATMLNFVLIALAGPLAIFNPKGLRLKLSCIGWIIAVIGALATTGYIFKIPILTFEIEGISNPMAVHTAILFVIAGIIFIAAGENPK